MDQEITKLKENEFDVKVSSSVVVKKDLLEEDIASLKTKIAEKKEKAGINRLETLLAEKEDLLSEINKVDD